MTNKLGKIALLAMTMGMMGFGNDYRQDKPSPNERKPCFRKGCPNHRVGRTELYCSEECKKLYKEENKK